MRSKFEANLEQFAKSFGIRFGTVLEQICDVFGAGFAVMHAESIYISFGADLA